MITTKNYFEKISALSLSKMPEALQKSHEFVVKVTSNGANWNTYQSSNAIKKTIDLYLDKLNEFFKKDGKEEKVKRQKSVKVNPAVKQRVPKEQKVTAKKHSVKSILQNEQVTLVEKIPEELRFIKRFVHLDGKTKTKDEILRFINSLQKAIVEKRIRKTSAWADYIREIQGRLLDLYNNMKQKIAITLKPETIEKFKGLVNSEAIMPSINFIKRYISLNGKPGMKEKAKQLLKQVNRAIDKGKVSNADPYISEINDIRQNLEQFIGSKSEKVLQIEKATLNGLEGVLGCACNSLNGIDGRPAIMNSMDFANMEFDTLGFTGKWLELIGDPSSNFTAMIFGKPKMGKSYLCVDFAGYLARNHGRVLYVAKEEGLDMTLQKKLNDKNVAHLNLFVSAFLPTDLSGYDFIFLDSVTRLGLTPEDLNRLRAAHPTKSFIFVFQTTKAGAFRGANAYQHDVDVIIEVPEKGKAVQMGRFNQGGEMEIFMKQAA